MSGAKQFHFGRACPFCGCRRVTSWHMGYRDLPWSVQCLGCFAEGPHAETEAKAFDAWDKRDES